jgi:hypothetical protein
VIIVENAEGPSFTLIGLEIVLCPFAVHYLRYAVTSFFTISRISLADGKRAGQYIVKSP